MIRLPPSSPLFPYTTLFRSRLDGRALPAGPAGNGARRARLPHRRPGAVAVDTLTGLRSLRVRSEEHTSELQSLRHLVCRLLLEKKKYKPIVTYRRDMRTVKL